MSNRYQTQKINCILSISIIFMKFLHTFQNFTLDDVAATSSNPLSLSLSLFCRLPSPSVRYNHQLAKSLSILVLYNIKIHTFIIYYRVRTISGHKLKMSLMPRAEQTRACSCYRYRIETAREVISFSVFIKYCVFSKNSRKFATSPSPALGCYWLYKKLPANRSDCTIALR